MACSCGIIQTVMNGFVACFAQRIQNIIDVFWQYAFFFQNTDTLGLGVIILWKGKVIVDKDLFHDPLSQHTKFIDAGIRVREQVILGGAADLIQNRPITVQEIEIGSHSVTSASASNYEELAYMIPRVSLKRNERSLPKTLFLFLVMI